MIRGYDVNKTHLALPQRRAGPEQPALAARLV